MGWRVPPLPHHSGSGIVHLKPRGLDIPEVPCPHRDLYKELCLPLGAPAAAQVWLRSPRCPPGSSCGAWVAPWDGKGPLGSVSWGSPQTQLGLELCLVTACSTSASWGLTETCSAMGENSLLPAAPHCWFLSSGSLLVSCRSAQLQVSRGGRHNQLVPVDPSLPEALGSAGGAHTGDGDIGMVGW